MKTLAVEYFLEFMGFDAAKGFGSRAGRLASKEGRIGFKKMMKQTSDNNATTISQAAQQGSNRGAALRDKLAASADKGTQMAGKVGGMAGQAALGATYVGAAFVAYKGLMKLKDRFMKSNNPQEKQNLQKQIDQGQAKLQRVKDIERNKKKQQTEKRQRDFQRKG